ncbi:hypothetical protein LWI29_021502 [Acer saccharum]|uniref:BOI-related E3 ubiquitin-protein ligase 3 n=1 Tax=Acer saccharum TaxID=4024 RepID=A0AA39S4N8_ACESA|nr:hypothetical protein LWI29_021502 [Acer saccharum]KAK1559430.1 hypothetical protein Q3G72_014424 [Acer saccharum]
MAIQAQLYNSENIGFPFCGSSSTSPQDWMMMMPTTATTAAVAVENPFCVGGVGGGFNQFCFNTQQKQQIHQFQNHHHHQQQKQSLYFENSISVEDEKQRLEIDHYIRSQNEKLRLLLQEQRKQQLEMILKKIESKASTLLRQKDGEIIKVNNRAMELEILLKKLEMENQAWQRMALEYESMVFSLNNTLEQMREKATASCFLFNNNNGGGGGAGVAEDAESCCDVEEDHNHELEEEEEKWKLCKRCNSGDLCVVFLPCRHLCSCKACDAFLDSCPVCLAPKKASIEVLID